MATDYIEIKNQISLLKQDTTAITLKNLANEIETSNTLNWIQFNLDLADVISKTKKKLLLILSIMLGGFVGIIYVFINKALVQRKIST